MVFSTKPYPLATRPPAAKAEHELQHLPEAGYVVKIEKHPADNDNKQRVSMPHHSRQFFQELAEEQLFNCQENKVIQPPEDEIPACAVANNLSAPIR